MLIYELMKDENIINYLKNKDREFIKNISLEQLYEIFDGIKKGIDVSYYDNLTYSKKDMEIIKNTLLNYPTLNDEDTIFIKKCLKNNWQYVIDNFKNYNSKQKWALKNAANNGVNIEKICDYHLNYMQMNSLAYAISENVYINDLINPEINVSVMDEIIFKRYEEQNFIKIYQKNNKKR